MINKTIRFKLIREDLIDWIYIKPVGEDGKPFGAEQLISYDEFESMKATRVDKNLYEYELSAEEVAAEEERLKRIEWMRGGNRLATILLAVNGKMFGAANAYMLSGIVNEYIKTFGRSFMDFAEDARIMKDVIQMEIDRLK